MIGFRISSRSPIRSIYRSSNDTNPYHWVEAGPSIENTDTTPIVLFHGIMASSVGYRFVFEDFAKHHPTIMVDLVGHGRDQSFRAGRFRPTCEEVSQWAVEFLEFLDVGPVNVVGHSLGGVITYLAVQKRPDLFRTTTLVAPGFRIPWVGFSRHLLSRVSGKIGAWALNDFWFRVYEVIQWRNVRMNEIERQTYVDPLKDPERMEFMLKVAANLLENPDRIHHLRPLDLPTQVIWGAHDHMLPKGDASVVAEQLLARRLHMFKLSGHCPMEDEPKLFANTILEFIES